ncbi:hypothetical protein FB451DRAFT_1398591 [Mycena latifolia]|nr:hypothetical protein FB451DRAFT_1398591 [Mycena latifolia]
MAKRKQEGEVDMSDDSDNEVTPILVVNGSGLGGPSTNLNAGGPVKNPSNANGGGGASSSAGSQGPFKQSTNPYLIADDDEAAQNSLDISESTIPKAIFILAKAGIAPPLTVFTPKALQKIQSGSGTKSLKVTMELKDSAHLLDISLFPDEGALDQADWTTCYNSFLKFIQIGYGKRTFLGFAKHFEAIIVDSEFKSWFAAFCDFDIRLCSQFFLRPFIVDPTGDSYGKLLQAAKNRALWQVVASPGSSSVTLTSGPSTTGPARTEKSRPHGHPYGGENTGQNQKKNSFRGISLCLHGSASDSHCAIDCNKARPSCHVHQFTIYANKNGLFRVGSDTPVCFSYNLASKCKYARGNHAIHVCSLCAGEHPAVRCTRN